MAITFAQEQKRQRNLMILLVTVVFAILVIVWWGFFKEKAEGPAVIPAPFLQKVEINFDILKKAELQALNFFPEIPVFEGKIGRSNPFIPY